LAFEVNLFKPFLMISLILGGIQQSGTGWRPLRGSRNAPGRYETGQSAMERYRSMGGDIPVLRQEGHPYRVAKLSDGFSFSRTFYAPGTVLAWSAPRGDLPPG
jgi:hypothetical protein